MQDKRQGYRAIFILVVFEKSDHQARCSNSRSIERVNKLWFFFLVSIAGVGSAGLKVGAVGNGRDFVVAILSWQVDFDIDCFCCGKRHVACAQQHVPIVKVKSLKDLLCACNHSFKNLIALIGLCEGKHLHFIKLVGSDETSFLRAGGASSCSSAAATSP